MEPPEIPLVVGTAGFRNGPGKKITRDRDLSLLRPTQGQENRPPFAAAPPCPILPWYIFPTVSPARENEAVLIPVLLQGQTYDNIIEETLKTSRADFLDAGIPIDYLETLRTVPLLPPTQPLIPPY